jgi:hypothetical protein
MTAFPVGIVEHTGDEMGITVGWTYHADTAPQQGDVIDVQSNPATFIGPISERRVHVTAVNPDGSITAEPID